MMKFKIPIHTLPFILLAFISLIVYLCAPTHYVWGFDLYCGIHYIVSLCFFFFFLKKKNYFDFDTIFLISYFFVFFVYSIFLYPISPTYFVIFAYSFNLDIISRSTALALLGSQMYILGAIWFHFRGRNVIEKKQKAIHLDYLPTNIVHYFTFFLFTLFIITGGYDFFVSVYRDGSSLDEVALFGYIFVLFNAFFIVSLVLEFNKMRVLSFDKFKFNQFNKLLFVFFLLSSVILLSTGTRSSVLQILLSLIGLFSLLYYPIKLRTFIVLLLIGSISMSLISATRGSSELEIDSFADIFMDLIINNRNTFTAVEYVDNNGVSYGVSMLAYILKVVPFMQGVICSIFNLDPLTLRSAMILTVDTLGEASSWGLGTNIIADLYLAFGVPGVILFMLYLGYIVHKVEYMSKLGDVYYLAIYTVLISLSVYMVRSEFFYGLSLLVWTLCIVNVFKHFARKVLRYD